MTTKQTQVISVLECAREEGVHAYFGDAAEKKAVRQLAKMGIAKIISDDKRCKGKVAWTAARLA